MHITVGDPFPGGYVPRKPMEPYRPLTPYVAPYPAPNPGPSRLEFDAIKKAVEQLKHSIEQKQAVGKVPAMRPEDV